MNANTKIGNGYLDFFIPIAGVGVKKLRIYGGPFSAKPQGMYGICLREEMVGSGEDSIHFPIEDFSVPEDTLSTQDMVANIIVEGLKGNDVYVGCMAGRGRTGLVLSLVTKAMRITSNPVGHVRLHYYSHAVENDKQYAYVTDFPSDGIIESAVQRYMTDLELSSIAWKKPKMEATEKSEEIRNIERGVIGRFLKRIGDFLNRATSGY